MLYRNKEINQERSYWSQKAGDPTPERGQYNSQDDGQGKSQDDRLENNQFRLEHKDGMLQQELKKSQMDRLPDMLGKLRDFRFFTLEEFGDELIVDIKEYSNELQRK